MSKSVGLLLLSVYLSLQLVASFPYQNSLNGVEDDDLKGIELQHSKAIKSAEEDFRYSLQPVLISTLDIIQEHSNTLILESANFLDDMLVELNTLPEDNEYIQELVTELTDLLDRIEKLDLSDESTSALNEKAAVLRKITKMYANFDRISKSSEDSGEEAVLKEVFKKLDLEGLNERINKSSQRAVDKFKAAYAPFWESLSDAQKEDHVDLAEWYERFQGSESVRQQLGSFVDFLNIIRDIIVRDAF